MRNVYPLLIEKLGLLYHKILDAFSHCFMLSYVLKILSLNINLWIILISRGIYKEQDFSANNTRSCRYIRDIYNLTKHQMNICKKKRDSMPFVYEAARLTVRTCQKLFQYKRWNCSTLALLPRLLPDLNGGKSVI